MRGDDQRGAGFRGVPAGVQGGRHADQLDLPIDKGRGGATPGWIRRPESWEVDRESEKAYSRMAATSWQGAPVQGRARSVRSRQRHKPNVRGQWFLEPFAPFDNSAAALQVGRF